MSEEPERENFIGACKAVVFRHRAAWDYDKAFVSALTGPDSVENQYEQEKCLFGFFTSSLAAIESFYFGTYFVGWELSPNSFGLASQPTKIKVKCTSGSFKQAFPSDLLTAALSSVPGQAQYDGLCKIRHMLAHRIVPNRIRHLSVRIGAGSDSSVFTDRPDTWKLPQSQVIDAAFTAQYLHWLSATLATLMRELWDFTQRRY